MFASTGRGFMGPLRGRGDKYYEDVYGKRNDEDPAGDACESESDSDGAVAGVFNKQRTIDSYGRIKKRKGSGLSSKEDGDSQRPSDGLKVNARQYKISPSQNARHSVEMIPETARNVKTKLSTHKFGMFGGSNTKSKRKDKAETYLNTYDSDEDLYHLLTRPERSAPKRTRTVILISEDSDTESNTDRDSSQGDTSSRNNPASPKRFVTREDVLQAAAQSGRKHSSSRRQRTSTMNTAYVDLTNDAAPSLETVATKKTKDGHASAKRTYSRLEKRPYVLEEGGESAMRADADNAHVLSEGGKKFRFVNWKGEVMWLAACTGVVVVEPGKD